MAKLYSLSKETEVSGFDLNRPINEWPGVKEVDEKGRITSLKLSFNKLTGEIPREIGQLIALNYLYLFCNQLTNIK